MSGWWCNVLDGSDRCVTYWIVEAIALLEIPVSGWMCNIVLDGGDSRHVMYWMVEIPVSGWPLLCWRYPCQDGCVT